MRPAEEEPARGQVEPEGSRSMRTERWQAGSSLPSREVGLASGHPTPLLPRGRGIVIMPVCYNLLEGIRTFVCWEKMTRHGR
jgi:hypothetical protein